MDDQTRSVVRDERRKRGWSVRRAAGAGHISNTTWGRYEAGELELSGGIRNAIAVAFGWPPDWPDRDPHDWDTAVQDATHQMAVVLERLQGYVDGTITAQLDDHSRLLAGVAVQLSELTEQVRGLLAERRGRGRGAPAAKTASDPQAS